jgi:epoxyqueuosine reductase
MGFDRIGIADPRSSDHIERYRRWLGDGAHGEMTYLARPDAVARRENLALTLEGVRSAVVVAQGYPAGDREWVPEDPARAVVARYAPGGDYHAVMVTKLHALLRWLRAQAGTTVVGRTYVDTGPLLERELGQRAGLGWFGKNTMLIHPRHGSYFFLGVLLLDLPLPFDPPFTTDHCGTCTRCLSACPTEALLGRGADGAPVMDARRCISYLTIEHRGPIPEELRRPMGNRVFGCDICQEVCPWNERFAGPATEPAYSPRADLDGPLLIELAERLLAMSEKQYQREFEDSPLARPRRKGMLRNVCVALGNWGAQEAVSVLVRALEDPQPLVRGHAAWALGRIGSQDALRVLSSRLTAESDPFPGSEIELALNP